MTRLQTVFKTSFKGIAAFWLFLTCLPARAIVTLGQAATNVSEPVSILVHMFYGICYILSVGLFLGGLVHFKLHRDAPSNVPLSRSIWMLIMSLIVFGIPFISHFSESARLVE